jgi:Flp pilus assembly protein TadD
MHYVIGSGDHAESYVHRSSDLHFQSPITWYRDANGYGLSPGYQQNPLTSFSRPVTASCLFCHAGRLDRSKEPSHPYRFNVIEASISCERCHGPGKQHVQQRRQHLDGLPIGMEDSIVQPASLTRDLSEAICQQCHLQGDVKVHPDGKDDWSFRPGQALVQTRVDYHLEFDKAALPLVGHVEQMHQSACYQGSNSFTCTTCHDPHQRPDVNERVTYYRDKCAQCHDDTRCTEPLHDRHERNGNDCTACHMPRLSVHKQPHLALHQHRVGRYSAPNDLAKSQTDVPPKIVEGKQPKDLHPILPTKMLSQRDRERSHALAVYELSRVPVESIRDPSVWSAHATEKLIALQQQGVADPGITTSLARLAELQGQANISGNLASEVLQQKEVAIAHRIEAMRVLGQWALQNDRIPGALKIYRRLTALHYDSVDLYYLGTCEERTGNRDLAKVAYQKSLELNPFQTAATLALAAILEADGDTEGVQSLLKQASVTQAYLSRLKPPSSRNP